MKRLVAIGLMFGLFGLVLPAGGAAPTKDPAKEALQALGEFVGEWKGNGGPDKPKPGPKDPFWTEKISLGWRFKGDACWLTLNIKDGKFLKSGEIRFLTDKKVYELTALDKDNKKMVFEGPLKNDVLTLTRTDPDTKETQQLTMESAAEGVRLIYRLAHKKAGTTLFVKDFLVAATREGVTLGPKEKKNLCVVSGGIGTSTVSYKGETFYVCCSGCAEAFKENPEKYIAEFKAKQKKP